MVAPDPGRTRRTRPGRNARLSSSPPAPPPSEGRGCSCLRQLRMQSKPENVVICLKTFSILSRGDTGARQGISQLIQHQCRSDLVSAGADISGRADEPRAGGCGRFGVGGGPPSARVEKRSQWSCCAVERRGSCLPEWARVPGHGRAISRSPALTTPFPGVLTNTFRS